MTILEKIMTLYSQYKRLGYTFKMSYIRNRKKNLKEINKGQGFKISLPEHVSENFSIAYIELENGRDPVAKNTVITLNKGYTGLYLVTAGTITFNLYENSEWNEEILASGESIYLTAGTLYEISGTGTMTLINFPSHSNDTYSHPPRP